MHADAMLAGMSAVPDSAWRSRVAAWQSRYRDSLASVIVARTSESDLMTQAAALAFYSLLSMAPLVVLLLWLTASMYQPAQEEFFRQLSQLLGPAAEEIAREIVRNAERRPSLGSLAGLLGTVTLVLAASAVFAQLQSSLNRIFQTEAARLGGVFLWIRKRLLSIGIVFALSFVLIVSLVVQTALQLLLERVPGAWPVTATLFSFALYAGIFTVLYQLLPDRAVGWRYAWVGGVATAALFQVGRFAIGFYLGRSTLASAYGPAGTLAVMLVWIYYSGLVFYAGAVLTSALQKRYRSAAKQTAPPG